MRLLFFLLGQKSYIYERMKQFTNKLLGCFSPIVLNFGKSCRLHVNRQSFLVRVISIHTMKHWIYTYIILCTEAPALDTFNLRPGVNWPRFWTLLLRLVTSRWWEHFDPQNPIGPVAWCSQLCQIIDWLYFYLTITQGVTLPRSWTVS